MRISALVQDSVVDGPGFRLTVFTQGCPHRCEGCHNPQTHDPEGGYEACVDDILLCLKKNPLMKGLTLSGGEPFLQPGPCAELARRARTLGVKSVWAYSGWTFEELVKMGGEALELLRETDVLVDGPFILSLRSLSLPWRGSKNQRLIDVKRSLETGAAVIWEA